MTAGGERGVGRIGAIDGASPTPRERQPGWVRWSRRGYCVIAWLFVACVVTQIFLAGMATFVDPLNWTMHTTFIHFFEYLPLLLLALVFAARFPVALRWLTVASVALIIAQYATAHASGIPAAFHPVSAMVLFWIAVYLGQRSFTLSRVA